MALKGKEKANIEESLYAKLKQNAYNERIRKSQVEGRHPLGRGNGVQGPAGPHPVTMTRVPCTTTDELIQTPVNIYRRMKMRKASV